MHPELTGAGVIVAIIDDGFDFSHGSFRDSTGRTRVLAIWALLLGGPRKPGEVAFRARDLMDPTKRHPERGIYYDCDDVNFSLGYSVSKQKPVRVRTKDSSSSEQSGHGTHVAGIAVGDGSPRPCCRPGGAGRYQGVAPGADIIVVRGPASDFLLPLSLSFIDEIAADKPVVVNASTGYNDGPHDGSSPAERAIDLFVSKPGRIFVKSAGNEGNTKKHGRVTVPPQQAGTAPVPGVAELEVVIPPDSKYSSP